jgi:hypothetical protein
VTDRGERFHRAPRHHVRSLVIVIGAFVISRVVIYALGVRFDASPLYTFLQFADPELLHHRLLETVWYLHTQPPLYNLFLGTFLKVFPHHFDLAAHIVYLGLGLVAAVGNYVLSIGIGLGRRAATALAVLLAIAPFTLVYENWLSYEYPMMVLLVLIGIATVRYARGWRFRDGFALFTLMAIAVYTRQVFQLPWLMLLVGLLALASRRPKAVLQAAAVPLVLVVLLYAKNIVVFGVPTTSSWFGMNMARITLNVAPRSELQRLVGEGKLSQLALIPPLSPLSAYRGLVPHERPTGVPVLDRPLKSTGAVNLNAKPFIEISRRYATQSLKFARIDPKEYAKGIAMAAGKLSVPATDYSYVYPQRDAIRWWDRIFNFVVYLRLPGLHGIGWFLPLMYLGVCTYGLRYVVRVLRMGVAGAREAALLVLITTVVYVLAVSAFFDYGENQRVHLIIDDVLLVVVAAGLLSRAQTFRRLEAAVRRRRPPAQ